MKPFFGYERMRERWREKKWIWILKQWERKWGVRWGWREREFEIWIWFQSHVCKETKHKVYHQNGCFGEGVKKMTGIKARNIQNDSDTTMLLLAANFFLFDFRWLIGLGWKCKLAHYNIIHQQLLLIGWIQILA